MRIFIRMVIVAALAWLAWALVSEVRSLPTMDENNMPIIENEHKVMMYYGGIVLLLAGIGGVVALSIIPAIGDQVGSFFYNPNEEIEKDPHADALAAMAQGEYVEAIKEYFNAYENNSMDTHALSEIAHIYCDKLHEYAVASDMLEEALRHEWPEEENAFLSNRLVDVRWKYLKDPVRARELLIQIAEAYPDTRYSANALHRLTEIDRELSGAGPSWHPPETPGTEV